MRDNSLEISSKLTPSARNICGLRMLEGDDRAGDVPGDGTYVLAWIWQLIKYAHTSINCVECSCEGDCLSGVTISPLEASLVVSTQCISLLHTHWRVKSLTHTERLQRKPQIISLEHPQPTDIFSPRQTCCQLACC